VIQDGTFILTASNIAGGGESLEAQVPHAWQNFVRPGDVNNDGKVTALDALRIINELGRRTFSDPDTKQLDDPLTTVPWPGVYFDQNGDDRSTALDALRVINELARQALGRSASEGEIVVAQILSSPPSQQASPLSQDEFDVEGQVDSVVQVGGIRWQSDTAIVSASGRMEQGQDEIHPRDLAPSRAVDQLFADDAFIELLSS
jgi:hypothetical protein